MTHINDFSSVSLCGIYGSSGQWNGVSANSPHFTPQVSLTSLNTLLRLSRSLRCTLLNSDFSWLSLQHAAVRDYHILKKILLPQLLHWVRGPSESMSVCSCCWVATSAISESLHELRDRKPHRFKPPIMIKLSTSFKMYILMWGFYTGWSEYSILHLFFDEGGDQGVSSLY